MIREGGPLGSLFWVLAFGYWLLAKMPLYPEFKRTFRFRVGRKSQINLVFHSICTTFSLLRSLKLGCTSENRK